MHQKFPAISFCFRQKHKSESMFWEIQTDSAAYSTERIHLNSKDIHHCHLKLKKQQLMITLHVQKSINYLNDSNSHSLRYQPVIEPRAPEIPPKITHVPSQFQKFYKTLRKVGNFHIPLSFGIQQEKKFVEKRNKIIKTKKRKRDQEDEEEGNWRDREH